VTEEVAKLSSAPPDDKELERAVNSHESSFLDGLEPVLQRAILLANYDVMAHDPAYFPKDLARYRAVKTSQVKDATAKYLKPTARVVLTIKPGKKPEEKQP
jgi:predicted Zn-dependent peptidase